MNAPMMPFVFLALSMMSVWFTRSWLVWVSLASFSLGMALAQGTVTIPGLLIALCAGASIHLYYRFDPSQKPLRILLACLLVVFTLGLFGHFFPGFRPYVAVPRLFVSPDAYPTSIVWNFDKAMAGLFLIGWGLSPIRSIREWARILPMTFTCYVGCVVVMAAFALPLRVIAWHPSWTPHTTLFTFTNLFLVCIAEEAFFRGFVQRLLSQRFETHPKGIWISVGVAAIVFGVCHAAGGLGLIIAATAAGVFYGTAYERTGRLEAAILVHFFLNLTHFALFTYPALVYRP